MEAEILCTGLLSQGDFTDLIATCDFLQQAFFFVEKLPQYVITAKERQGLLWCDRYDTSQAAQVATYTSGRIFYHQFELRWELERDKFRVVYLGTEQRIPYLRVVEDFNLTDLEKRTSLKRYYLFGERLRPESRKIIGPHDIQGDFAELRIPRLLHYPVDATGRYVKLAIQEYVHKKTGRVELFRFQDIKAVE